MKFIGFALGFWFLGGLFPLLLGRRHSAAAACGVVAHLAASAFALAAAITTLASGKILGWRWDWPAAAGQFHIVLDPLAAWFLFIIALLSAVTAIYGWGYWKSSSSGHPHGAAWCFSNLLAGGMALVVLAGDAVLFLAAWEIMTLASFFLVTHEDDLPQNRRAGWIYLVASHVGAAFLILFFLWRGSHAGSLDFTVWAAQPLSGQTMGGWFLLALIGFGFKAGFIPLHVWLPEAHPAAPSHISALMSGVMVKTGIYGLMRCLGFFNDWPEWWGWVFLGVGLASGILGVLLALAQKDLKRLLAYSTVENIGIVALGMGIGVLGISLNLPALAVAGWAAALLHVLNHAFFKGLLFLGAGSVLHATHTRNLEQLGGLLKRMPWTGACFLTGAVAICGVPPLNGFLSEVLLYSGAISGVGSGQGRAVLAGTLLMAGLALIGGLAVACFAKAFGIAFLGEPRREPAAHAHEAGAAMKTAMGILAVGCAGIALLAPRLWQGLQRVAMPLCPLPAGAGAGATLEAMANLQTLLFYMVSGAAVLIALVLGIGGLRHALLRRRSVSTVVTWDCGYARPTARMQYSASSFVEPITTQFHLLLRTQRHEEPPKGYFPSQAFFVAETPDTSQQKFYQPLFVRLREALGRFRWLQHGNVHLYVLYLALTLLALLLFSLR